MPEPRRFVISDIHGCAKTFRALLKKIHLHKTDTLYLLGDYVNRGPRSKEVLDTVMRLYGDGHDVRATIGNHDELLLRAYEFPDIIDFFKKGPAGKRTLKSFGVKNASEIPAKYYEFLKSLPLYFILDEFILVHAGLNFSKANPFEDIGAMMWTKKHHVEKRLIGGRRLICGHSPRKRDEIFKSLTKDKIFIDNGCVKKKAAGLGSLCALELNSMKLYFQENVE
jgi:serine/threonine protein phosphatase 1